MDEAQQCLTTQDPNFKVEDSTVWSDHVLKDQGQSQEDAALAEADSNLIVLSEDARKKAWEHDCLQFARDVAQIGKIYAQVEKSSKAERMRKILHLREENAIGASMVDQYMTKHASHRCGSEADIQQFIDQASGHQHPRTTTKILYWFDLIWWWFVNLMCSMWEASHLPTAPHT